MQTKPHGGWVALALRRPGGRAARSAGAGHDRHHRGDRQGPAGRRRAGRHRDHHRGGQGHVVAPTPRTPTGLRGALPDPRHLRAWRSSCRASQVHPQRRRAPGQPARARRRDARARRPRRGDGGGRPGAPHPHRLRRDGRGDRGAGGARAAAERPQLRDARLPGARASPPARSGENLSGASTFNPRGASNFNALGSQANTNAWLVDGIDNNEYTFNTVIVQPTVESVREFKVLTGTFSAEFGRGAGVVSVSTKSGNNEWHGTAFEYLRNERFDAKNFFALPTAPKAPLDRHQFGAALSGPIVKNRTFFFVDYAGIKEDRGQVFVNTVPTEADAPRRLQQLPRPERQPDPDLRPAHHAAQPERRRGVIRDPFPGNVIPADRLDAVGRNVASIYPLPERAGQLRQLHLDRQPLRPRPLLHRPRRPPRGRPRQLLRPLQLREVQARRAPGPGRLLPGDAPGGGGAVRPRALRGRHPEHAPHHPRRRLQLDPPLRADRRQRAAPGLREDQPRDPAVGLRPRRRDQPRHPGHQHQRVHDRPAQHRHRSRAGCGGGPDRHFRGPGLPAREPEADPLPARGHALVGHGPPLAQDRLSLHPPQALPVHQRQHPQQHHHRPQPDQQPADQQRRAPASPPCCSATRRAARAPS